LLGGTWTPHKLQREILPCRTIEFVQEKYEEYKRNKERQEKGNETSWLLHDEEALKMFVDDNWDWGKKLPK